MPVVYSFPVRRDAAPGGGYLCRPVLDVRLSGPAGSAEKPMLVDSGADASLIERALADQLGLALGKIAPGRGASGRRTLAWRSRMIIEVRHADEWLPPVEVSVSVLVRGTPPISVLGRGGFFEAFDILFRLGPVPQRGMFYLVPHGDAIEKAHPRRPRRPTRSLAG